MSVAMEEKRPSQGMRKSERSEDLITRFNALYEIIPADTPELLEEAFRLRYRVLCEEAEVPGFDDPSKFPDGIESDVHDQRSAHVLLKHRSSRTYVGNVRLVLPHFQDPDQPLPIEEQMGHSFDRQHCDTRALPRRHLAEISRLVITRDALTGAGPIENSRSDFGIAVLGLFKSILKVGIEHQITHWMAAVEPALARMLRSYGVRFTVIGPMGEFYGKRQPILAVGQEIMDGIYFRRPDVWDLLSDRGEIWPAPEAEEPRYCATQGVSRKVSV